MKTPGTLLHRKLTGEDFSIDQHILAAIADGIAIGNWQRQGKPGAKRPPRISPLGKRRRRKAPAQAASGRTQKDIDGLLTAMKTGAFSGG
jgi:hypothetical protein